MNREVLTIEAELRVVTEASIWLVRPSTYLRLPRTEGPRAQLDDLDGATRDAEWHEHEGVWLLDASGVRKLNVLPNGRPEGSRGLFSGPIEQIRLVVTDPSLHGGTTSEDRDVEDRQGGALARGSPRR